jgi:RluA family pseudouridine synthase
LIVIDKPAGLPTQPTLDASRPSAFSELKAFLQSRDGAEPYLGLQHRLDRDTSGVLLFTKDPKANAGVGALFSEKTAQKTYQALSVSGPGMPDAWELKNYLGIVGKVGKASKYGSVRSGGDPAQTAFRVLERFAGAALVEAQPRTGRTHQIRVHLAASGAPILGDELYGGPLSLRLSSGAPLRAPRILLHASSLSFRHPMTSADLTISCPLPEDFVRCLVQLRDSR